MSNVAHTPIGAAMLPLAPTLRILAQLDRPRLEWLVEAAVTLLDLFDGDPDEETVDPDLELTGDERDAAWIEWHTMRGSQKRGPNILCGHEDDEESDPAEDDDPFEDDDPDHEHDGRELEEHSYAYL